MCVEMISCSEKSYAVCVRTRARARVCVNVCDLETTKMRPSVLDMDCCAKENSGLLT